MKYACSACSKELTPNMQDHTFALSSTDKEESPRLDSLYYCGNLHDDAMAVVVIEEPETRVSRDALFMRTAYLFAERSTCLRAHVGAVIVKDKRIISTGYAGSPPGVAHCTDVGCLEGPDGGCIRTTHAEMNAIVWAAKAGVATDDTIMYSTHEPCLHCAKAIATAGIRAVYFSVPYRIKLGTELLDALMIPVKQLQGYDS
jgi:dCMP deaminase